MVYTEFCRLIKNVKPEICKSRSLNTLTVWFICGTALIYVALFPPMDAMIRTGLPGVAASFRYPPIPSLFPQELNSFDPFRVLMKIQQINQRFSLQPMQPADKAMTQTVQPPPKSRRCTFPSTSTNRLFKPLSQRHRPATMSIRP